jgi:hypothetical protein
VVVLVMVDWDIQIQQLLVVLVVAHHQETVVHVQEVLEIDKLELVHP